MGVIGLILTAGLLGYLVGHHASHSTSAALSQDRRFRTALCDTRSAAVVVSTAPVEPRSQSMAGASRRLDIAIVTMNGFQLLRAPDPATQSADHVFRLRHIADGTETSVTVSIELEAVERVARLTHRRLEPGGSFWRSQAERLLSAYVWSEGKGPADGRLIVHDVSRDDLDVAARWNEE